VSYSYLASPYQNPDDKTDKVYCAIRFNEACAAAAKLMAQGRLIFCPIAHSHPIADHLPPGTHSDHDFWLKQDFALLAMADNLLVLQLHQWKRSYGVGQEIAFARAHGIPVKYLDPEKL
jgi:Domain of unknown function (DUF1937)